MKGTLNTMGGWVQYENLALVTNWSLWILKSEPYYWGHLFLSESNSLRQTLKNKMKRY